MAEWLWFTVVIAMAILCNYLFCASRVQSPTIAFFLALLCSPVPVTWQTDTHGYILQIHNQLVMLSFGIELGIKKFFICKFRIYHCNCWVLLSIQIWKQNLDFYNPMLKKNCSYGHKSRILLLSLRPLQVFFGNTKYGKRFGHVHKQ